MNFTNGPLEKRPSFIHIEEIFLIHYSLIDFSQSLFRNISILKLFENINYNRGLCIPHIAE
jgi:hypothetical protein